MTSHSKIVIEWHKVYQSGTYSMGGGILETLKLMFNQTNAPKTEFKMIIVQLMLLRDTAEI